MGKTNKNQIKILDNLDLDLLQVINTSYLSIDDIKWLKSRRWVKRFLKIYAKELKKRYNSSSIIKKENCINKKESIEVLDFTQSIKLPPQEVIEILDFTKTIDISSVQEIAASTKKAKDKIRFEKNVWGIIAILCTFILIILLVIVINSYFENQKTTEISEKIYDVANVREIKTTTSSSTDDEMQTTTKKADIYADITVLEADFDALKNINIDTVGWVKVSGTKINYPFVQYGDNDYYLKHSYDKTSNKKGWVFLDYRNDINLLSKNTIIYAHGLVNNQMFGSMRNIFKQSWYKKSSNHIIKISTPEQKQLWQVFSVYTIEPESYYITTEFPNDNEYIKFLETIKSRSNYNFDVELSVNDNILTLSSCYDNEKRMVLHAKLIN